MKQAVSNRSISDLLQPRAAAGLIPGCSYQSILRWAREGKVPFVRLPNGRILFRRSDIEALLEPVDDQEQNYASLDVPFPSLSESSFR